MSRRKRSKTSLLGQTSYAGIIRIRFKATRSCGLLRSQPRMPLSAPVFMSSKQYTPVNCFVKKKQHLTMQAFKISETVRLYL